MVFTYIKSDLCRYVGKDNINIYNFSKNIIGFYSNSKSAKIPKKSNVKTIDLIHFKTCLFGLFNIVAISPTATTTSTTFQSTRPNAILKNG